MSERRTLPGVVFESKGKVTRRERFLQAMDAAIHWTTRDALAAEVISLAGYTTALNGEVLAFTFIYNGTDRWQARAAIDAMGVTLSGFARE